MSEDQTFEEQDAIDINTDIQQTQKFRIYNGNTKITTSQNTIIDDDTQTSHDINKDKNVELNENNTYDKETRNQRLKHNMKNISRHNSVNGWTKIAQMQILKLTYKLKYNRIINNFFYFELKSVEQYWSWIIIILSALTSILSILNNIEKTPFAHFHTIVQGSMIVGTTSITLIASWMKKQQYVVRINEIDRYLQRLNNVIEEVIVQLVLLPQDRMSYDDFKTKYLPIITEHLSAIPAMSPIEWKKTVYKITTYYPELIEGDGSDNEKLWPWYSVASIDNNSKPIRTKTQFGETVSRTFTRLRKKMCMISCCMRYNKKPKSKNKKQNEVI